jgi:hypothetical protein
LTRYQGHANLLTGAKTNYSLDASNQVQGESAGPLSWYNITVEEWSDLSVDPTWYFIR